MIRWLEAPSNPSSKLGAPEQNRLGTPTLDCHAGLTPASWPLALGASCLSSFNAQACQSLASQALANASQPYWNMPVPNLYEQDLISWLLKYGWLNQNALNACTITLNTYGDAFDAATVPAAQRQILPVSFDTWLRKAPVGVVIAERKLRAKADFSGYEWDVRNAKFYAPPPDPDFDNYIPAGVSIYVADNVRAFMAAWKALLLGQEGKLSDTKEWFCVYAPNLSNAPTEWS